jgi:hypothetical protein
MKVTTAGGYRSFDEGQRVEFEIQQGNKGPAGHRRPRRLADPIPPLGQQPASLEEGGLLSRRPVVGIRPHRGCQACLPCRVFDFR